MTFRLDGEGGIWFDPTVRKICLSIICLVGVCWLAVPAPATAWDTSVDLADDEQLVDLAWINADELLLLVETAEGFALRRLLVADGSLAVVSVPRNFNRIKDDPAAALTAEFRLAPGGTAIAVLERTDNPLNPSELSIYTVGNDGLTSVPTHRIPDDFWPELIAWEPGGSYLYLASKPYIQPEQPFSVGRLDVSNGCFEGLVIKDNVDLVERMVFVPQRNALALRCQGYHGEYPEQPIIVLVEQGGSEQVLHSEAEGLELNPLDDGQLLIYGGTTRLGDGWLLALGADALKRVSGKPETALSGVKSSCDGRWLAWHAGSADEPGGSTIDLQTADGSLGILRDEPSRYFSFAPDSQRICNLSDNGRTLRIYDLPE